MRNGNGRPSTDPKEETSSNHSYIAKSHLVNNDSRAHFIIDTNNMRSLMPCEVNESIRLPIERIFMRTFISGVQWLHI